MNRSKKLDIAQTFLEANSITRVAPETPKSALMLERLEDESLTTEKRDSNETSELNNDLGLSNTQIKESITFSFYQKRETNY